MRTLTRYSLDVEESRIVSQELVTQIDLAKHAMRELWSEEWEQRQEINNMIERIGRRFNQVNLTKSDTETGVTYNEAWNDEVMQELRAVASLVVYWCRKESDPVYWWELGVRGPALLPKDLATMRARTAERLRSLIESIESTLNGELPEIEKAK